MKGTRNMTLRLVAILLLLLTVLTACGKPQSSEDPAALNVHVDESGLATWDAVDGAKAYEYVFVYNDVGYFNSTTVETGLQIPEGYELHIRAVFENGEYGYWFTTEPYGDPANRVELGDSSGDPFNPVFPLETGGYVGELPELKVTVDENGLATWEALEGTVAYIYGFLYDDTIHAPGTTTETSIEIPEGYALHIRAEFADGTTSLWATTEIYGDPANRVALEDSVLPEDAIQISVDENGLATWEKDPGNYQYYYSFYYLNEKNERVDSLHYAPIVGTQLRIPEGYLLYLAQIDPKTGEQVNWGETKVYGDPAKRERIYGGSCNRNYDVRWESLSSFDIVSGIKRDTVRTNPDGSTYFEVTGPKNEVIRFVATGVTLTDKGVEMAPSATLTALDAIGTIFGYEFRVSDYGTGENNTITANGTYTFSNSKLHVNDVKGLVNVPESGVGVDAARNHNGFASICVADFQPNFIGLSSNGYGEDSFTLSEIMVYYDESSYCTPIAALYSDPDFFRTYLEGELYDPSRETCSLEKMDLSFYLVVATENAHVIDAEEEERGRQLGHSLISCIEDTMFKVGALKDASGKVMNKATDRLKVGSTLEVTIGDYTKDLELPVVEIHKTAENMHDLVPYAFPEAKGEMNVLVVPIKWQDEPENATDAVMKQFYAEIGRVMDKNGKITDYSDGLKDRFSLSKYYDIASYGKLNVQSFVTDWYDPKLNFADVRDTPPSDDFIEEMLEWVYATYPNMDFSRFDKDRNGYLDAVILLNAGSQDPNGYNIISFSGGIMTRRTYTGEFAGTPSRPAINCYTNANAALLSGNVLIHEFAHNLGLIDYYDVTYSGINAVGNYDMQSSSSGDWNAYSKYSVGWIEPEVVQGLKSGESVEIEIGAFATTGDAIVIPGANSDYFGTPFSEYIVIDLLDANKGVNVYDADRFGVGQAVGVRIYHVNALMERRELTVEGKDEVYPIGTVHYANDYDKTKGGRYNIELIQAGKDNTFTDLSNPAGLRTQINSSDLFKAGDKFTVESYGEFFENGKMDDGTDFGYEIEIVRLTTSGESSAVIRITKK